MMTSCTSSSLYISLQQRLLHKVAKDLWGRKSIPVKNKGEKISLSVKKKYLISYRDSVIKDVPEILKVIFKQLTAKNLNLLIRKVVNAVFMVYQGYYEALVWENRCKRSLPFPILFPETAGIYKVSNFVEPTGHFNDLEWVKLFVGNDEIKDQFRFELACFYCLKDELTELWGLMRSDGPFVGESGLRLFHGMHPTNDLAALWAFKLSGKFFELKRKTGLYAATFRTASLYEAVFKGHEYAVHFFWAHFTREQRNKFVSDFDFDYIFEAAEKRRSGIVHFLYTVLSSTHSNLSVFTKHLDRMPLIWARLLQSQFYSCALNDIMTFPQVIAMDVYSHIVELLLSNIKKFKYPFEKVVFKKFWNHLTTLEGSLEHQKKFSLVSNLVYLKQTDLIAIIIEPCPSSFKNDMLQHDWLSAGKSTIDEISKTSDYDTMLRYFVSFLMCRDFPTQMLTVRADAEIFLESLIREDIIKWTGIDKTVQREIINILENLRDTLSFLQENLLENVELSCNEMSTS